MSISNLFSTRWSGLKLRRASLLMLLVACSGEPSSPGGWTREDKFCHQAQGAMFAIAADLRVHDINRRDNARESVRKNVEGIGANSAMLCSPLSHPLLVCAAWPHDWECWSSQLSAVASAIGWWYSRADGARTPKRYERRGGP